MGQERKSAITGISSEVSGSRRSRYKAFINQRNSAVSSNDPLNDRGQFMLFGQGLINFAIFIALFVGILALFGFGLSRFNRGANIQNNAQKIERLPSQQSIAPADSPGTITPPTVYPSGHAEVQMPKRNAKHAK